MSSSFKIGLALGLCLALYLTWLWRPAHQVELHSAHLLGKIERKNWSALADALDQNYRDDWQNDRALLLERIRLALHDAKNLQLVATPLETQINQRSGIWRAKIEIAGEGEFLSEAKARVNRISAPFELEWRRQTGKPWDWKLVRVRNAELTIPPE